MKRSLVPALIVVISLGFQGVPFTGTARAATITLTMSSTNIIFPDQDPDVSSTVQGNPVVTVTVKQASAATWSLTAISRGDLQSAGSIIPIGNISWSGVKTSGDTQVTFYNGNLTTAVTGSMVASGSGKDMNVTGTLTFYLKNLWSYDSGNYSQTTDFTLASP